MDSKANSKSFYTKRRKSMREPEEPFNNYETKGDLRPKGSIERLNEVLQRFTISYYLLKLTGQMY